MTLALFAALSAIGQSQRSGQSGLPPVVQSPQQSGNDSRDRNDGPPPGMVERQARLRNDERQKRLVADTDKLLELATQLHADVGKTDKNILSVDVIKRADEIEKLAHAVKERMKG